MEIVNPRHFGSLIGELFSIDKMKVCINIYFVCMDTTFFIFLFKKKKTGVYGKLESKIIYKCYISYMVNLFSKYIKTEKTEFLLDIQNILYNHNFILATPYSFSITNELKLICLKGVNIYRYKEDKIKFQFFLSFFLSFLHIKMTYLVKMNPFDKNSNEFRSILASQDFLEYSDSYDHYTTFVLYRDVCILLNNDKFIKEKSFLKKVVEIMSGNCLDEINFTPNQQFNVRNPSMQMYPNQADQIENNNLLFHNMDYNSNSQILNNWQNKRSISNDKLFEDDDDDDEQSDFDSSKMFNKTFSKSDIESLSGTETSATSSIKTVKKAVKWDENELVHLVFFVEKLGTAWGKISVMYKKYFNNRNARDLKKKYYTLKTNHKSLIDSLIEQANLLDEKEILIEQIIEKKMYIRWDEEEVLYLGNFLKLFSKIKF